MFGTPITQLDFQSVTQFLDAGFREGFTLDYKRDFPEHLDRVIAAFANTWGGVVLIGVEETPTGAGKCPPCGIELRPGLRERVLRIALDAIYPPLVPEVHVIPFSSTSSNADPDRAVVVIRVHESDQTPHSVDGQTAFYLRTDNVSTRHLRKATISELEWLMNKREKSIAERARILRVVEAHAAVYRDRRAKEPTASPLLRKGQFTFHTVPRFPRSPLKHPCEMTQIAQDCAIRIPAVPHELPSGLPQPVAEGIIFNNGHGTTEVQQQGMIYHAMDFWWDFRSTQTVTYGVRFVLPKATAALLWGMLKFAARAYCALGFAGLVDITFSLEGVRDVLFRGPQDLDSPACPIVDDVIVVRRTHSVADLRERTLEIAAECQREIYWSSGIKVGESTLKQDFDPCRS